MSKNQLSPILFLAAVLGSGLAQAHTGASDAGFAAGLLHPLSGGWDHLLFALASGLWMAHKHFSLGQGLGLLLPPLMIGMLIGVNGNHGIVTELLLGLSAVVAVIMLLPRMPLGKLSGIAVLSGFTLMHGVAHGNEMIALSLQGITAALAITLTTGCIFAAGHFAVTGRYFQQQ